MNRGQNKAGKRRTWEQVYETDGHQEARRTLLTLPEVPAPSLTSHFTKGTHTLYHLAQASRHRRCRAG